eukprot:14145173-Alexandrium_andersonii.AAC.1
MTDLESVQTWMPPSACTASNTAAISALVDPAAGPAMLALRMEWWGSWAKSAHLLAPGHQLVPAAATTAAPA